MPKVAKHVSALSIALLITLVSFSQTVALPTQPSRAHAVELA